VAAAALATASLSKWRMELRDLAGGATLINDSYNANPDSTRAAIEALRHLARGGRRGFAVLGHMAELGDIADDSHAEVGRLAAQAGVAGLIAVGE
jgi:UDP-N-acetylmuramoyl-tripeptide--D-alanyl-D-alanine ligase